MEKIKEILFKEILSYKVNGHISIGVFIRSLWVLNEIYTEDLVKVILGEISYSPQGTVVVEWDIEESTFSLEIGEVELEYSIEVGPEEFGEPKSDLKEDLAVFIKRLDKNK